MWLSENIIRTLSRKLSGEIFSSNTGRAHILTFEDIDILVQGSLFLKESANPSPVPYIKIAVSAFTIIIVKFVGQNCCLTILLGGCLNLGKK